MGWRTAQTCLAASLGNAMVALILPSEVAVKMFSFKLAAAAGSNSWMQTAKEHKVGSPHSAEFAD